MTVALPGDRGKPRPALVIQADQFDQLGSVTVLPLTGTMVDAPLLRVVVDPTSTNGLSKRSHIMVDKAQTPSRTKIRTIIGHLEGSVMLAVDRTLVTFLGLA